MGVTGLRWPGPLLLEPIKVHSCLKKTAFEISCNSPQHWLCDNQPSYPLEEREAPVLAHIEVYGLTQVRPGVGSLLILEPNQYLVLGSFCVETEAVS